MIIILASTFIIIYIVVFFQSFKKISRGKLEYLILYICLGLPIYITLQSLIYKVFQIELFLTFIKISKDLIFYYSFFILIFGTQESILKRNFSFSLLDKLFLLFSIIIIIYMIIPYGEASFFSKIIYAKNLLIIPIVYSIGRNVKFDQDFFKIFKKAIYFLIIVSSLFIITEYMFSTHFHSLIDFSKYNFDINNIESSGNYGLSWSFESQNAQPRFAAFFSNPLEYSSSLIFLLSFILYSFYYKINKIYIIYMILIFIGFYLSFSRGAIVSAIMLVFLSLIMEKKFKLFLSFLSFSIIMSIIIYFFSSEEFKFLIYDTLTFRNTSSLGHLIEWFEGLISIYENPLGIGLAMSGNAGGVDQSIKVGGENQFLILGVQMGLIMLFVYILILFKTLKTGTFMYYNSTGINKHLAFSVILTKFGLLIPLLTANAELYLFVSLISWFIVGNIENQYQKNLKFIDNSFMDTT